jgi:gamma-glutamyltranspeptidase/glutathione hydrolase
MPNAGQQPDWAIASPFDLSSDAGADAFTAGGNAIDAALATAVSLAVALPDNCALGGDMIALLRDPDGSVTTINSSGPAAAAVSAEELRQEHGQAMPIVGAPTVTVPGILAGWEALWAHGANLPWSDAFAAGIDQARDGVPVAPSVATALIVEEAHLRRDPGLSEIFYPGGQALTVGERLVQPRLAETLEQIRDGGAATLYSGPLGESFLGTLNARGSDLSKDDLASFEPEMTAALQGDFLGLEVHTAPPNSQGAVWLMILEQLTGADHALDPLSDRAPELAMAVQAAGDARTAYLADPRYADVDLRHFRGGRPDVENTDQEVGSGLPSGKGDTVAIVAADGEGRAISLIQSLFYRFGTGILDPGTGIIAHNRGASFSLDPESPNCVAPRKRPAHTLTPGLVCRNGELEYVIGTMGGLAQPQVLTQVLLGLCRGLDCEDALGVPRWLVGGIAGEAGPSGLLAEAGVPAKARAALGAQGWQISELPPLSADAGEAHVIAAEPDGYSAESDPRSKGSALTARNRGAEQGGSDH